MSEGLVFKRHFDGFFKISNLAHIVMLQFAQDEIHKPESGGVLLGRHIVNTKNIVVDRVTTPMPADRQARFRFFRSRNAHQQVIDQVWQESKETCTYLGEWHTHPESVPTPSLVDQFDWRRKLMFDRFSEHLFFVIVGTYELRVWEGRFRCSSLFPLEITN